VKGEGGGGKGVKGWGEEVGRNVKYGENDRVESCTAKTKYRNFETNIPRKKYIGVSVPISTFMRL
jgi:hypothetical protein